MVQQQPLFPVVLGQIFGKSVRVAGSVAIGVRRPLRSRPTPSPRPIVAAQRPVRAVSAAVGVRRPLRSRPTSSSRPIVAAQRSVRAVSLFVDRRSRVFFVSARYMIFGGREGILERHN